MQGQLLSHFAGKAVPYLCIEEYFKMRKEKTKGRNSAGRIRPKKARRKKKATEKPDRELRELPPKGHQKDAEAKVTV